MSIRETCGKQNDKNRICKNAHIQIAEYVHFIYLAQLNAWTSGTFYKKQSKKTVHYQKKLGTGKKTEQWYYITIRYFPGIQRNKLNMTEK